MPPACITGAKKLLSQAGIDENIKILRLVTHFRKPILDHVPHDVVQMDMAAERVLLHHNLVRQTGGLLSGGDDSF
jgi:hypothetical protein